MTNSTLADEINVMIDHKIKQLPVNQKGTIKKVYNDPTFVDIQLDTGIVNYVKCIGTAEVGAEAVLFFLNNSYNEYIVITQTSIDENMLEKIIEDVIGEGGDLSDYVKKEDLIDKSKYEVDFNLNFGISGRDDIITVETFLKQK